MKNLWWYYFWFRLPPEMKLINRLMDTIYTTTLLQRMRSLRKVAPEIGITIDDDWTCHYKEEGDSEFTFSMDDFTGLVIFPNCVCLRLFAEHPLIWIIFRDTRESGVFPIMKLRHRFRLLWVGIRERFCEPW